MSESRYLRNRHRRHARLERASGNTPLSLRAYARHCVLVGKAYPEEAKDPHANTVRKDARIAGDWMARKGMGL